jgi:drug/metabolite transporter (DMT)-like permease
MPHSPERRAYLLLAAVIVTWGVNWPILKFGLAYITPLWFAAARALLGAACLFLLMAARGRVRLPRRADLGLLLSVGVLQIGVNLALVHIAVQLIEAGRSVILAYTTPLWVTPLAAVFLGERLSPRKVAGVGLGVAGLAVLFGPSATVFVNPTDLLGNGLPVLAAMISAGAIVHVRSRGRSINAFDLAPWQILAGAAVVLPAALAIEGLPSVQWSATLAVVPVYNGAFATAFGLWAYVVVMRDLPAVSTAVGSLGVPVVGLLASAVILGEPLSMDKGLGLALIVAGVLVVTVFHSRRA